MTKSRKGEQKYKRNEESEICKVQDAGYRVQRPGSRLPAMSPVIPAQVGKNNLSS